MEDLPVKYYHEFECSECEGHLLIEADTINELHGEDWYPKFCPYCGTKGPIFIDWKHEVLLSKSIDVAIRGDIYHTEDIGIIDYAEDGKYKEL